MAAVGIPQWAAAVVSTTNDVFDKQYDGLVLVNSPAPLADDLAPLQPILDEFSKIDGQVGNGVTVIPNATVPGGRIIASPTGKVSRAIDDVRRVTEAAAAGFSRALAAGCSNPLLVVSPIARFEKAVEGGLLGALSKVYHMLGERSTKEFPTKKLGVYVPKGKEAQVNLVTAMESGKIVARDICSADPAMFNPPDAADYISKVFGDGSSVKVTVTDSFDTMNKEYPCLAAVARASMPHPKHHPRVVELDYKGEGEITNNLLFVGKGVCYDTGGLDLKVNGSMKGMARDKGGAAAIAGFFRVLDMVKPKGLRVHAKLGFVVNDIGPQAYRSDEIITSRAGVKVHVGNTDAEGRMVMVDLVAATKEMILAEGIENKAHMFTVATLTGHVLRAYGSYPAVLDNGPAAEQKFAQSLQDVAHNWGDPFEISTLRRNEFDFIKPVLGDYDVLQSNTAPSSATARGHQFPMAFMMVGAGLDKHCIDADKPVRYSHMDIAGAAGFFPDPPTGSPVVALAAKFCQ
eukprot:TRINITY_DN46530_c0_g1_i1.p1 TRINITY_DN46530_c0_g1~~TRINITY_DN46530_c0_g1_i1.p1  ORF type:complete len:531 (+),score=91.39 TRINITY_DN46530_c0_g1_i1:47-1594(+)